MCGDICEILFFSEFSTLLCGIMTCRLQIVDAIFWAPILVLSKYIDNSLLSRIYTELYALTARHKKQYSLSLHSFPFTFVDRKI